MTDNYLNKIFCWFGLHKWKSHYGFSSYQYNNEGTRLNSRREEVFKCGKCGKIKTKILNSHKDIKP